MRSQYSPPATRWVFATATLAYLLAMVVAPAQHFGEEGAELSALLAEVGQLADVDVLDPRSHGLDGSQDDRSAPFPHHGPDEIDCLFCQALSAPAHPALGDLPSVASFAQELPAPRTTAPMPAAPFRANGARAPPFRI